MALSKEAQEALEELIRMMAKYGAANYRFDVGGSFEAPQGQRLEAFDTAIQRMHAEAPSVLQNLASMPKDPYYQAMYGLAEASGARLGEAMAMESDAISQLAGAAERGVLRPDRALALAQAYQQSEAQSAPAAPPVPPESEDLEMQYLAKRQRLLADAAKPVADLIRARSEAAALGDETAAEAADRWIAMLAEAASAASGTGKPWPSAPEGEQPEGEETDEEKKKKFADTIARLRKRLRRLY